MISMKAGGSSQKLMLFSRGNAMSGAPIISGMNQLPNPPIRAGMTVKKIITRPCAVTIVFHSWPEVTIVLCGHIELRAHDHRQHAADHAGEDGEDQVKRADILVVGAEQPARDEARLVVVMVMHLVMREGGHRNPSRAGMRGQAAAPACFAISRSQGRRRLSRGHAGLRYCRAARTGNGHAGQVFVIGRSARA